MTFHDDARLHPWAYRTLVAWPPGAARSPEPPVGPIVVGIDGERAATDALCWAAEVAGQVGAEVVAVHALPLRTQVTEDLPTFGLTPWRRSLEVALTTAWTAPLRASGIPYRVVVAERTPACALLAVAEREGASRLVLGCHARSRGARLGGRLFAALIHQAPCPVIAVPGRESPADEPRPGSVPAAG